MGVSDNQGAHGVGLGAEENNSTPSLLALKDLLRRQPKLASGAFQVGAVELARGYHALLSSAPRRSRPYLSQRRTGLAPVDATGRRKEERLAMAWFNSGKIQVEDRGSFDLLDYQLPLKSKMSDQGIGKIDLLARCPDGCLAVIELKAENNPEDRRIALLEGLIYAAILEANAATIALQLRQMRGCRVTEKRPKVIIAAPLNHWTSGHPPAKVLRALATEVGNLISTEIGIFTFESGETQFGLDGSRPQIAGPVHLFALERDRGAPRAR